MKKTRNPISGDMPEYIKLLRAKLGLTQQALADLLNVSFATVNRWENGQTKPSNLSIKQLAKIESESQLNDAVEQHSPVPPVILDFAGNPEFVKLIAEGERLSFGHLTNPAFGTEISSIDPLPHQRIAVYDAMLKQSPLRFLLADDAGAGKTIMTGLYIREMLSRRLLRRVLIVPPAGLIGNWQRELLKLFNLPFKIVTGSDTKSSNPFVGENSNHIIVSIDTLTSSRVFSQLKQSDVEPYDLVVFDEAHKLGAGQDSNFRVRKTQRYRIAETLAGVPTVTEEWKLSWKAYHLLLLTATPHMGKDYPYYALWRLLDSSVFSTAAAFYEYPPELRKHFFIRRTKEEMVYLDGRPLYPKRISDTLGYELSQGQVSEQKLYDETTDYLRYVYNRAKLLNREAARLAMSVFQRRLASSTYSLMRSFERRIAKLTKLIDDVQAGKVTPEQLELLQKNVNEDHDVLDCYTADDEKSINGKEENEVAEEELLTGGIAISLLDLQVERDQVKALLELSKSVLAEGHESKFDKLREVITDPSYDTEKLIVFTEHRDTLVYLVNRLSGLGYTGQIAQIHGGMNFQLREEEVERFRKPVDQGGARFLICTDAAGEGINLQFCWIMINYDVPWNPARLEQRMGRIHRYGQKHDPVIILNLVAPATREGKVLKTLLDKLEKIRKELKSDKVFDCIGRIFADVSIREYMELAITESPESVATKLEGHLSREQVEELVSREKELYGKVGDVEMELPRLRTTLDQEVYQRLLPGYVRQYIEKAAPFIDLTIDGNMDAYFSFRPVKKGAMNGLLPLFELYPEKYQKHMYVGRPAENDGIWLHPGEPVFERFRTLVTDRLRDEAMRGAVFVDATTDKPYLFHLAVVSIIRQVDLDIPALAKEEMMECRIVGVKQLTGAEIELCPVEHLLLLKGSHGLPPSAQRLAVMATDAATQAQAYLTERVARKLALERKNQLLDELPQREKYVQRGFDYQEAELANARAKHTEKARSGNRKAMIALEEIKTQQRQLASRRTVTLKALKREPELVSPGTIMFIAHALVVPVIEESDLIQLERNAEIAAMKIAQAYEETAGAIVHDVHLPELARKHGLSDYPGFDLLSIHPNGEKRSIEVKGRIGAGDIEISSNEWAKACNLRDKYWLYSVFNCGTPNPELVRVQDPFGKLLAKSKSSVLLSPQVIRQVQELR